MWRNWELRKKERRRRTTKIVAIFLILNQFQMDNVDILMNKLIVFFKIEK